MIFRKRICDCCGSFSLEIDRGFTLFKNRIKETYDERCSGCGNLLYGYSKLYKEK